MADTFFNRSARSSAHFLSSMTNSSSLISLSGVLVPAPANAVCTARLRIFSSWTRQHHHLSSYHQAVMQETIKCSSNCRHNVRHWFASYSWRGYNLSSKSESRGNYSATSNNMKLVHWPLMSGLLHLVQRGGDWAGPQPAQAPPRCTKCNSPPVNGQYTNHRTAV